MSVNGPWRKSMADGGLSFLLRDIEPLFLKVLIPQKPMDVALGSLSDSSTNRPRTDHEYSGMSISDMIFHSLAWIVPIANLKWATLVPAYVEVGMKLAKLAHLFEPLSVVLNHYPDGLRPAGDLGLLPPPFVDKLDPRRRGDDLHALGGHPCLKLRRHGPAHFSFRFGLHISPLRVMR